jgi:excisionase family DNA binding protein
MDNQILNYKQASEVLGIKVQTLYAMVCLKKIPHIRLSPRLVRFSKKELEQILEQNHVPVKNHVKRDS